MNEILPQSLRNILRGTPELADAHLVGGCVRDWLLGIVPKDFDVEVYGVPWDRLVSALSRWGRVDQVGKSFGVIKLTVGPGETHDFSLPRRDSKVAPGHRGFAVEFAPDLQPEEASARRDFTINSLMWHPRRSELLDFHGGRQDLQHRRLRHTSAAFDEDPLRVLRGMQFAGRFGMTGTPETLALCRGISSRHEELALERIRAEWFKWAGESSVPSAGLLWLRDSGWIRHYPEIEALGGVPQDPEWHPEGDVWVHTLACLDALVRIADWTSSGVEGRVLLSLATLCHDFGKPACTRVEERQGRNRIISPGHEAAGVPLAERFLNRIGASEDLAIKVGRLVASHLAHLQENSPRSVRRLANRLAPATLAELDLLILADASGRPPAPPGAPPGLLRLRSLAEQLQVTAHAPRPILLGRHLIERGLKPGPDFSRILSSAFEAQLDGDFEDLDGALRWLDRESLRP